MLFQTFLKIFLYFLQFVVECGMNIPSDRALWICVLMEMKQVVLALLHSLIHVIKCHFIQRSGDRNAARASLDLN